MKWSKQLCAVLILSLMFIMTSINSTSSVFMEYKNPRGQVVRMDPTLDFENFIQSSVNETTAYGPPVTQYTCWGWTGNLSFTYWDVTENEGIPGANVTSQLGFLTPDFFDLGNGSYLVEVNTTYLRAQSFPYSLVVSLNKEGFENQVVVTMIRVYSTPTSIEIFSPEENQYDDFPHELVIPIGDSVDLLFFYNDTEDSDGYVGGLAGASADATIIGPTLISHYIELTDNGNGFYNVTFNTKENWLYESVGGVPTSHTQPYELEIVITLENRGGRIFRIFVFIVDVPTAIEISPISEYRGLSSGLSSFFVTFTDMWPTHEEAPIQDANITVESSDQTLLEIVSITKDSPEAGVFEITLNHTVPASVQATVPHGGCMSNDVVYTSVNLTINIEKNGYEGQRQEIIVDLVVREGGGGLPPTPITFPVTAIVILVAGMLYFRYKRRIVVEILPENE